MREWLIEHSEDVNKETYENIMKYIEPPKDLDLTHVSDSPKKKALLRIEGFTLNPTFRNALKLRIKVSRHRYEYQGYTFQLFSSFCSCSILFTKERYGNCAIMATYFAKDTKLDILTAICTDFRDNCFLHTVLLGRDELGNEYVLDYTRNIIMPKKDYYDLLDVKEVRILSNQDFREIYEKCMTHQDILKDISIFDILCFPKETLAAVLRVAKENKPIQNK